MNNILIKADKAFLERINKEPLKGTIISFGLNCSENPVIHILIGNIITFGSQNNVKVEAIVSSNKINFDKVEDLLNGKGLKFPPLFFLDSTPVPYRTIVIQPKSILEFSDSDAPYVRNVDGAEIGKKVKAFIEIAIKEDCHLVCTPEYCVPWNCISELIADKIFPKNRSLWVLCCESITPKELKNFIDSQNKVIWIHEAMDIDWNSTHRFFDVACHLFVTEQQDSTDKVLVGLLQFKTFPMGIVLMESNRMILGTKGYIFASSNDENRLVTIICSDALNFKMEFLGAHWKKLPTIVFHPQLTTNSRTANFTSYRFDYFRDNHANQCNKEFIILNWAKNTEIRPLAKLNIGGSGIYARYLSDIGKTEQLEKNEKKGAYFTFQTEQKASIFYLEYEEHLFIWENDKIDQAGAPQNQSRKGIRLNSTFKWNAEKSVWEDDSIECAINEMSKQHDNPDLIELFMKIEGAIDKERFIAFSIFDLPSDERDKWFIPRHHQYFLIDQSEIIKRTTFKDELNVVVKDEKKKRIARINELLIGLNSKTFPFSKNLEDLKENCQLGYLPDDGKKTMFYMNLFPQNNVENVSPAVGCYLGSASKNHAEEVYGEIKRLFNQAYFSELPRERQLLIGLQSDERIIVWFKVGDQTNFIESSPPDQMDKKSQTETSFIKKNKI